MRFFSKTLAVLLLAVLHGIVAGQSTQTFEGRVRDILGAPIAGAEVACSPHSGTVISVADENGNISVKVEACPDRVIEVSAPGFAVERIKFDTASADPVLIILHPSAVTAAINVTGIGSRLGETAVSVMSINKLGLETSGALTLDDRLRQIPGFTLFRRSGSRTANPTAQGVSLRGVGASGSSRALVLKDRIPLNDPFGGWVYWGRVPAESITEVEVLRGTASDLYGNAAVGGVVAISTFEPATAPAGSIDASYGSQRTPFFSGYGTAGMGRFAGSLGAELFGTDGFIPVEAGSRGPVDDLAGVRRLSLVPTLEWRRAGSRIFAAGDYYREVRRNGSLLQNNDTLIKGISAGADETTPKTGTFVFRSYFLDELYHQSFSAISTDRRTEALNRLQSVPSSSLGFSGQWTASLRRNVFIAGADLRYIRGRSDETSIVQWRPTVESSAGGREMSGGVYVGAVTNSIPRTVISGGVRADRWHENRGYSATRSLSTGASTTTYFPDRVESAFSPRASVLFRVSRNVSLAATYGRSFRQPTLNELYRSFRVGNVLTLANEDLKAERGRNIEAALILNSFSQKLYARLGVYCTTIDDAASNLTVSVTPALITRMRQTVGRVRTCGFESDVEMRLIDGLTIRSNYLHADARVRSQPGNPWIEGLYLPQVPRDQATFQVSYSRQKLGTASVQVRASGRQFDDDLNLLPLAGYIAVDAFVSHPLTNRLTIYAAAENSTNSRIEAGRTPVTTIGQTRTIRAGLRYRFGRR